MDWRIKAGVQKGLSLLPGGRQVQHWLQRQGWGSLALGEVFLQDRLAHVSRHLRAWHEGAPPSSLPQTIWEIGTGWYPVVPLGLYLCGCDRVVSTDLRPLWREALLGELVEALLSAAAGGHLKRWLPGYLPQRLAALEQPPSYSWQQRLGELGIDLKADRQGEGPLPPGSLDLVTSNNTLEHVPAGQLPGLFAACYRALRPGGCMSHYIDMVDHYSYTDARLPAFHFLRYEPWQWRWLENRFQSQNRLRLSQYQALLAEKDWSSRLVEPELLPATALPARLAGQFSSLTETDLRTGYVLWASTKNPNAPAAEAAGASDNAP